MNEGRDDQARDAGKTDADRTQAEKADTKEARPVEAGDAAPASGGERPRRVRRTTQVAAAGEASPAPSTEARGEVRREGGARKPRPRRRRGARPGERGERREERRADAGATSTRRKIYRQDPVAGARPVPPPPAPAAPQLDGKAAAKKKAEEQNKITLILHPAPKAAPQRRKKEARPMTAKEALRAKTAKRGAAPSGKSEPRPDPAAELRPEWLSADAASAAAAIEQAGEAGEALVAKWLEANNAEAIARAASLDKLSGRVRKSARRALGVLKSRGVELPALEEPRAPSTDEEPAAFEASFVPPDASGMVFFSISQRQPGGRYRVADAVIREPLGIMHASSGFIARKQIRSWQKRIEERYGTPPVSVPVEWARARIAAARAMHETSKQIVPLGFDSCAPLFAPAPEGEVPHPMAELAASVSDADVDKAKGDSERLHEQPEFQSWLPDRAALDEMLVKVGERLGEDGAQNPEAVDEALKAEIAAATDRFFTPELRELVASRMTDAAISVRDRAGDDAAKRVLAVARAVREAGLITSPPSDIPFLLRYFQKGVAVLARQGRGSLQIPIPRKAAPADQASP